MHKYRPVTICEVRLDVFIVCVSSVWVPYVALPSGGGSSAGSSLLCMSPVPRPSSLCRAPVGGALPCRVRVSRGICFSSYLSLVLTLFYGSSPFQVSPPYDCSDTPALMALRVAVDTLGSIYIVIYLFIYLYLHIYIACSPFQVSPPYDCSDITALMALRVAVDTLGSMVAHGKMGAHKHIIDKPFVPF